MFAAARFGRAQNGCAIELKEARGQLAERKLVDRAKGQSWMADHGYSEAEMPISGCAAWQ